MEDTLKSLLKKCPVLYPSPRDGEGDVLVAQAPQDYESAVGVTLDLIPEDNRWVASYSDFIESSPEAEPEDAVRTLVDMLRERGLA